MHPSEVLFQGEAPPLSLPVCDHYCGAEKLMRKSLALQQELGPVFDTTFDCEDGAAVGAERAHAEMVATLINSDDNRFNRVGVRIHDVGHPHWQADIDILVGEAGERIAYVTLPKVETAGDVERTIDAVNRVAARHGIARSLPIHALVETPRAVESAYALASLPQLECLSFGLMDYVSAYRGAIPSSAMGSPGQFEHPLVARAMLEMSAACHAAGKIPSHNVTTEIRDVSVVTADTQRARNAFGYLRKWSIHPAQIPAIVAAFAPTHDETTAAAQILRAARLASWGPIQHDGKLHDRASYRFYWSVLQRAQATGTLDAGIAAEFFS